MDIDYTIRKDEPLIEDNNTEVDLLFMTNRIDLIFSMWCSLRPKSLLLFVVQSISRKMSEHY